MSKIHTQPYLLIVHVYSYINEELLGFNLPGDLTLRFFKKPNKNLRFQIRIEYLKNESTQTDLLKTSFR